MLKSVQSIAVLGSVTTQRFLARALPGSHVHAALSELSLHQPLPHHARTLWPLAVLFLPPQAIAEHMLSILSGVDKTDGTRRRRHGMLRTAMEEPARAPSTAVPSSDSDAALVNIIEERAQRARGGSSTPEIFLPARTLHT